MSQNKAIVDKLLTNVSSAYIPSGYVSESVLPVVTVTQDSGKLAKYGNEHIRLDNDLAGGEATYKRVEPISRSNTSYQLEKRGLEGVVTEEDYSNVESPYDAERDEVMGLTTKLWIRKERTLAALLTSTATVTQNTTLSGTGQFSDYSNSDPLDKFKTARQTIWAACGQAPDTAVMDWQTANTLAYHPGILDALGFTQNRAGQLSAQELAKAMGIERLYIANAVYNSAVEGQSDSLAAAWGKNITFLVAPTSAATYQLSFGYRLQKAGMPARRVTKYSLNNPPGSTAITVDDKFAFLVANAACGYLIKDAIA